MLIVGAGPVGLLTALETFKAGVDLYVDEIYFVAFIFFHCVSLSLSASSLIDFNSVRVVEKRLRYERNIWFDLYPKPWSDAADTLTRLGYDFEVQRHADADGTLTLRCQLLERFLALAASVLGVEFEYGVALTSVRALESRIVGGRYRVVVGADGPASLVRRGMRVDARARERFFFADWEEPRRVRGLGQRSTVLTLKAPCPALERDLDARAVAFNESLGVSAAFRRFYYDHCHLQVSC